MFNKRNKKTSLVAAAYIATVLLGGYASIQHVYADNTAPTQRFYQSSKLAQLI